MESASWDERLHGFLRLTEGHASYECGRFGPGGKVYWISDESGERLVYQGSSALTTFSTLNFGFEGNGE